MGRLFVAALLGIVFCALVIGGLAYPQKEAFAATPCTGADCENCLTACKTDFDGDGKVTVTDVNIVNQCLRNAVCKSQLVKCDVDKNGVCNSTDYQIIARCTGCCSVPSPSQ